MNNENIRDKWLGKWLMNTVSITLPNITKAGIRFHNYLSRAAKRANHIQILFG
jgi:hypothetical protein